VSGNSVDAHSHTTFVTRKQESLCMSNVCYVRLGKPMSGTFVEVQIQV